MMDVLTDYSWGRGMFGRLGTSRESDELVPVRVEFDFPDQARIVGIAASAYHSLAVSDDGSVWCWDYNIYGQLGFDGQNSLAPCLVKQFFDQEASSSSLNDSGREARSDLKVCAVNARSMMSLAIVVEFADASPQPGRSQLLKNVFADPKGFGIGPDGRYRCEDPKVFKV